MTGTGDTAGSGRQEPVRALSIQQRLAEAMTELENVQAGVAKAEEELRQAAVTVRSRDRAVEVTVGPQGELTGLKFLDGKYRTMAAAELAASVLESAEQARTQMSRRVKETFEPFTRPSTTVPELTGVDVDWARIFGPTVLEDPRGTAGRTNDHRLRDEIDEDAEDANHHG
ncbi:YbaB/EbfC family nucleoid-associated protein [Streptomyces mirabilis]|uniref:YbaB/EbfC family nucleoid-associated protein n=1 Tax=Streptomyces mirabilis TaxID=68239 RepID=UPI00368FE279